FAPLQTVALANILYGAQKSGERQRGDPRRQLVGGPSAVRWRGAGGVRTRRPAWQEPLCRSRRFNLAGDRDHGDRLANHAGTAREVSAPERNEGTPPTRGRREPQTPPALRQSRK